MKFHVPKTKRATSFCPFSIRADSNTGHRNQKPFRVCARSSCIIYIFLLILYKQLLVGAENNVESGYPLCASLFSSSKN